MEPDQPNPHLTRVRAAHPLSRRAALGASETELLILLEILTAEHLSPRAVEALLKLNAAIDSNLQTQALLRGPSLADELIAERRAEAARELDL